MKTISIQGNMRADMGKSATKALRREDGIPCVLYGGEEEVHFSVVGRDVRDLVYTSDFMVAELTIDGKMHRSIVKDIQFHPVNEHILHIDFMELVDGRAVKVNLPVRFKGTSAGVKVGGKLQQKVRRVMVKVAPEDLVDELFVDVSSLGLGQSVRVRDIQLVGNMELLTWPSIPVATVDIPRALRSATAAAEK